MNVDDIDLDQPAQLRWMLFPEEVQGSTLYGGTSRDFGSIRNAVLFWADHVPYHQKRTAKIGCDDGSELDVETIALLLEIVRESETKKE